MNSQFRAKVGWGPTESEKQVSRETTVSDNSDAERFDGWGGVRWIAIARFTTSKSARLPKPIDPMPAAGATSARLPRVRAL